MAAVFANRQSASTNTSNENWKATAFLNLWVSRPDGTRFKLGAISLRDSKSADAKLIARLQQEGAVEALMQHLEIDFQLADSGKEFDVGF